MRAHYFQHVAFEGLGSIQTWLQKKGFEMTSTRFYEAEILPDIEDIDLLIVMGGPMSVNDEKEYPWLIEEMKFIKDMVLAEKPILGICLGAQLIAKSMGGDVYPNSFKEIGWFPVQAIKSQRPDVFQFPEEINVFHWHGETFSLPEGAVRIAQSKGCKNQAFQIGSNVIGLQFHLETTPGLAGAMVNNCSNELVAGEFIQTETEIMSDAQKYDTANNRLMDSILDYIVSKAGPKG